MVNPILKALSPLAVSYATGFLGERNIRRKQEELLRKKLVMLSNVSLGKELGASPAGFPKMPITTYELYQKYFEAPRDGDLLYPVKEYVVAQTSGTMGKPKKYLIPKTAIAYNMMKTGFAIIVVSSHDGDRFTFELGDVVYTNLAGGSHITSHAVSIGRKYTSIFLSQCPDPDLSYREKVNYFVKNHEGIDYAQMIVPTLIDEVYPRIGKPFHLKGFITQDSAAEVHKEEIRRITGNYPRVIYGATESLAISLPSVEYPGCFFFDWRMSHSEFIPEEERVPHDAGRVDEPPETVSLMDVEAGERYQIVVTPYKTDVTRYALPDVLECVADGDDVLGTSLPVFRYYARVDRLITLHNFTRIAEKEIVQVLEDAKIPFVDFVARREMEGTRDYMRLYVELSDQMDEAEVFKRIHGGLLDFDRDWRDLTNFLEYVPLKMRLMPRGSFRRYLEAKGGMPRVDRMEMRDEHLNRLLGEENPET